MATLRHDGLGLIAGAGTMLVAVLLVAVLLVAEPAFHTHLSQVQPPLPEQAHAHVDEAFANAVFIALAVGVATLTDQSQRLHSLVGDLSAVSAAEERQLNLRPVRAAIQDLVSKVVAAARPRFEAKGIDLTADEGPAVGSLVLVDPDRLAEALGALLDNALRHTAKGGTVTIATTRHDNRCRIAVTDTGDGFDPDVAAQLFERFYRGDSSRTVSGAGSGIGLTIAKRASSLCPWASTGGSRCCRGCGA